MDDAAIKMQMKRKAYKVNLTAMILFLMISVPSELLAELKLESVYNTFGNLGLPLENVILSGTGFDDKTRISMFPDADNRKAIICALDTPDKAWGITVSEDRAYIAGGKSGLLIIDISDPYEIRLLNSIETPGYARDVAVEGSIAYIADGDKGLQIASLANLSISGQIIFENPTLSYARRITAKDGIVYLGCGDGLRIIDAHTPSSPEILVNVDTWGDGFVVLGVAVMDKKVYLTGSYTENKPLKGSLWIIDISDPSDPRRMSYLDTPESASFVQVKDDFAYVITGTGGLKIVDIRDASAPELEVTLDISVLGSCRGITISENMIYVAADLGLQILDISDPMNPIFIGSVVTPDWAYDVAVKNGNAYVTGNNMGLRVIDTTNESLNPAMIGYEDITQGYAKSVTVNDNIAYVALGDEGFQVINIADKSDPETMATYNTKDANEIKVTGDTAFVADGSLGLRIIDISNPYQPKLRDYEDTPGYAGGIDIEGDTAYVADGSGGLQVIRVADTSDPKIIGALETRGIANKVAVEKGTAYVAVGEHDAGEGGLQIINVGDPASPWEIGFVNTPGESVGVNISGNTAYMACSSGLQIIDVADPSEPEIIANVPKMEGTIIKGVTVTGTTAYVAYRNTLTGGGLQITDIKEASNPINITSFRTPTEANDLTVIGNTAYVASTWRGYDWIRSRLTIMSMPMEIAVAPEMISETSISLDVPSPRLAGHYTLKVFNEKESDEESGAITFRETVLNSKAIIVAGGGPSDNAYENNIWEGIRTCTHYAYRALLYQGYTRENICYLTPEPDFEVNGLMNNVDGDATYKNLYDAINTWVNDPNNPADELLIYMADHGGAGVFRINKDETLNAKEQIDNWLDTLQQTMPGRLIFIYDACQSGTFIPLMRPPDEKRRIVLTSGNAEETVFFTDTGSFPGGLSFSFQFWARVYYGNELRDAFYFARAMMIDLQTARLDADGNGTGSELSDFKAADDILIGRGYKAASDMPFIGNVCAEQTLNGETTATLWADNVTDADGISSVWAIISSSCYNPGPSDMPVFDLPIVELRDADNDGRYEGIYDNFTTKGLYRVSIYAMDTQEVCSFPKQTLVTTKSGLPCPKGDVTGDMTVNLADAITSLKVLAGETGQMIRPDYATSDGVDVNEDGKIGTEEVSYILKKLTDGDND